MDLPRPLKQETIMPRQTTLGEYRVGITFNPSGNAIVDEIKQKAAELIDLIEDIPSPIIEGTRLKALAMTHIEDAAMWAVKAATKKPREDDTTNA